MTPRERFSTNLKEARRKAAVTQEDLADRCHLHRTEVSLLERGGREPRLGTIVKLASALDVNVDSLCTGIAWDERAKRFRLKK